MKKGMKRTNYWMNTVQYIRKPTAQSFLDTDEKVEKYVTVAADCSCNCYGDCSGGDCTSCSECG